MIGDITSSGAGAEQEQEQEQLSCRPSSRVICSRAEAARCACHLTVSPAAVLGNSSARRSASARGYVSDFFGLVVTADGSGAGSAPTADPSSAAARSIRPMRDDVALRETSFGSPKSTRRVESSLCRTSPRHDNAKCAYVRASGNISASPQPLYNLKLYTALRLYPCVFRRETHRMPRLGGLLQRKGIAHSHRLATWLVSWLSPDFLEIVPISPSNRLSPDRGGAGLGSV